MASGLFALLDDIAAIAKVAAASIDDTAAQAIKVGAKATGIVIDDTAVTPRYVVGFAADRELPIIGKIAWGSLKNKLLYLLPGALLLSAVAPWAITPLLMAGGLFLCFEGYEKVHELLHPEPEAESAAPVGGEQDALLAGLGGSRALEDEKVASAIRTDFILSAEIMAISLASITSPSFWSKAAILAMVGLLVTVMVYGAVALIVKADDAGVYVARNGRLAATRAFGRGLVAGMPILLKALSLIGTAAMLWVGGGIILHGLEEYGLSAIPHGIHDAAGWIGGWFGPLEGLLGWLTEATMAGIIGLVLGWLTALAVVRAMRMAGVAAH